MTGVFLSVPRYDWCAPLSHPSSCMLVNHGPSQQSSKRRRQAIKMRCYRRILRISYKDHVTNEDVRAKIQQATGPHEDLLTIIKKRKLQWYGHVSRSSGLAKTILRRYSERRKNTRQTKEEVGRQHQGMDRPGVRQVPEGSGEHGKMEETGCEIICDAPTTLAVTG